ncbi:hypothetical protein NHX12_019719 [Muraenolepis orangiensis]|uniref:Uncharacterized protein n=1 Tax=Muraenolepis orangiensis TaxID=630683 RepID=A0A9Q0EU19_9TELE|nr:hypothetical protein NHX12_019719 [Muraenolepis orangiensis]
MRLYTKRPAMETTVTQCTVRPAHTPTHPPPTHTREQAMPWSCRYRSARRCSTGERRAWKNVGLERNHTFLKRLDSPRRSRGALHGARPGRGGRLRVPAGPSGHPGAFILAGATGNDAFERCRHMMVPTGNFPANLQDHMVEVHVRSWEGGTGMAPRPPSSPPRYHLCHMGRLLAGEPFARADPVPTPTDRLWPTCPSEGQSPGKRFLSGPRRAPAGLTLYPPRPTDYGPPPFHHTN